MGCIAVAMVGTLFLLLAASVRHATGQPSDREGVLSTQEAQLLLAEAQVQASVSARSFDTAFSEHNAALENAEGLSGAQDELLTELTAARSQAIELAVAAYMGGGSLQSAEALIGGGGLQDIRWRQQLVAAHAGNTAEAASTYGDLAFEAGVQIHQMAIALQRADVQLKAASESSLVASEQLAQAEQMAVIAEAWARSDVAVAEGRYGEAPPENWERLRMCESSGNYAALSVSTIYRGAYQFDRQTWKTVGGEGDPAAASPLEQDARARELFARRGNAPWPVCGRFLP